MVPGSKLPLRPQPSPLIPIILALAMVAFGAHQAGQVSAAAPEGVGAGGRAHVLRVCGGPGARVKPSGFTTQASNTVVVLCWCGWATAARFGTSSRPGLGRRAYRGRAPAAARRRQLLIERPAQRRRRGGGAAAAAPQSRQQHRRRRPLALLLPLLRRLGGGAAAGVRRWLPPPLQRPPGRGDSTPSARQALPVESGDGTRAAAERHSGGQQVAARRFDNDWLSCNSIGTHACARLPTSCDPFPPPQYMSGGLAPVAVGVADAAASGAEAVTQSQLAVVLVRVSAGAAVTRGSYIRYHTQDLLPIRRPALSSTASPM